METTASLGKSPALLGVDPRWADLAKPLGTDVSQLDAASHQKVS